jgi:predicted DNA-binding transcriptional regulator YafY
MLELLQARERIGVPEVARRLEVGERTVRRYAALLREIGIPVEAELGRYGAHSLKSGYRLPPMMFTDEEALGLALGLLAALHLGLAGVLAGLDCSFVVRRPAELRDALEQRAEKIATLAKRTERAASSEKAANSRAGESSPADWRA